MNYQFDQVLAGLLYSYNLLHLHYNEFFSLPSNSYGDGHKCSMEDYNINHASLLFLVYCIVKILEHNGFSSGE